MIMKSLKGFVTGLLVGGLLMVAATSLADTVKQYLLVDAKYPVVVNGSPYENAELPILNYEGSTYIPMRAVGDILGANVTWNDTLKQAEIRYEGSDPEGNTAFRNIEVSGSNGEYTVTGEARVFEAVMSYAVSDGHNYLLEEFHQLNEGAPEWSEFTLNIEIPEEQFPVNGTLVIELFEYSANDGSKINIYSAPLESFGSSTP